MPVLRGVQASEKGVRRLLAAEKTKAGHPPRHLGWMKNPPARSASAKPIHLGGGGPLLPARQPRSPQAREEVEDGLVLVRPFNGTRHQEHRGGPTVQKWVCASFRAR